MRWNIYFDKSIPKGAIRIVKRFAFFPIDFPQYYDNDTVGSQYRWLEIVYIKQRWSDSIFGESRWFDIDFSTKNEWLNSKIYD